MAKLPDPQPDFRPEPGAPVSLAPGLRRILAPNPSPMTFRGTNTYLVGTQDIAVIDPGPDDPDHLSAILGALRPGQRISHILVTHAHIDHTALVPRLARETGAPVYGFGPVGAGRSALMAELAASGALSGGEGLDHAYAPDIVLQDGMAVTGAGWRLEALHLPGHMADHLGFALDRTLFCGDLVMGWSTSLISPPDGDLAAFMASLDRLKTRDWQVLLPGHGAPVDAPSDRIQALIAHRQARADAVHAALARAPADAETLAKAIYTDTPPALLPAAARNVLAQLIAFHEAGIARFDGPLHAGSVFRLT